MGTTRRGLTVSTDDQAAIDALDACTDRLARILPGVEEVLTATDRHPEVASLRLASAMLLLYGQTADTHRAAGVHLDAGAALEPAMNERERATLAAVRVWSSGEFLRAAVAFEALLERWPTDLLAIKALEFLYYVLGQQHCGPRFLAAMEAVAPANPDDADVLAAHAFAAELAGQVDRAEDLAEQALAVDPATPWAHHALAHAFIVRGNPPEDLARLTSFLPVWEASGRMIHGHNAWHLGVAHLDHLAFDEADEVFRDHVWGFQPDAPVEQIDAVSLLWRVELAGGQVNDERWADVADHVERRVPECVFPFLTAHHAYALARAGRTDALGELLATVAARAEAGDGEATRVWGPVGRPVVEACAAHGRGDLATAADLLDPVIGAMPSIGGSDAQDDLFRLAHIVALAGAGRRADAVRAWERATSFKVRSPADEALRSRLGA